MLRITCIGPGSRIGFALGFLAVAAMASGCTRSRDAERRETAQANATAEAIAQGTSVTSVTSATLDEGAASDADTERASEEIVAAFQLEQGDYRARLRTALDGLDQEVTRTRQGARREGRGAVLRARRSLLKADLDAFARCTEPDWATPRTKLDRDLASDR